MQQHFCDICGSIIKEAHTKHMLYQQEIIIKAQVTENQEEFVKRYQQAQEKPVDIKEICSECKKVFDFVFSLRVEKINKIKKEIEKSFNLKADEKVEYCQCGTFEDEGILTNGEETGICFECGKLSKPLDAQELKDLIEKEDF